MNQIHISLGHNCNPRIYLKKTFNYSKSNGYKSCPFDLCITPYSSLYDCIETDFKYFFDHLTIIPWLNAEGKRLHYNNPNAITNKYGMIFNHEGSGHSHLFNNGKNDDEYYTRDDFKIFKEKYSNRILNFRNYLNEHNEIIFVYIEDNIYNGYDIQKLSDLFYKNYPNKKFSFIEL